MIRILPADWRVHPIYLIGVGFVLGLGFDYGWLAPARLGDYRLEIADARNVVAKAQVETKKQSNRADAAEQKVVDLKKKLLTAERNARDALTANTFIAGSPYPIGLDSIRLGASLEQIEREVPQGRLEKKKAWWSIKLPGSVFDSVTLYWDERAKDPVVTHLLFMANQDATADADFLRQKLTHALGEPTEPQSGYYEWHLSDGTGVFVQTAEDGGILGRNYFIMGRGFRPGDWPSSATTGSIKR